MHAEGKGRLIVFLVAYGCFLFALSAKLKKSGGLILIYLGTILSQTKKYLTKIWRVDLHLFGENLVTKEEIHIISEKNAVGKEEDMGEAKVEAKAKAVGNGAAAAAAAAAAAKANNTTINDTSIDHTSNNQTINNHTSTNDTSANHTSANHTNNNHTSTNHTSANDTSANHTNNNHTSTHDTSTNDTSTNDTSTNDTSANDGSSCYNGGYRSTNNIYLNVKGNPISSGSVLLDANGRNQDVTVAYRCGSNFYDATCSKELHNLPNNPWKPNLLSCNLHDHKSKPTIELDTANQFRGPRDDQRIIIGSNPTMQDVKNYLNSTEILGELSRKGASVPWYALYILLAESANPQQFDASGSPFYKTNITGYLLNSPGIGLYQISTERFGINLTCQHVWSWKQNTKAAVNVMLSHELLALNEAYFGRCNSQKMCGGSPPPKTVQIPTTSEGCNANRTSCGCTFVDTNFQRPNANNGSRNQFPIEDAFAMKLYHDKTVPYYRWINGTAAYPNGAWNYTPCNLITSVNLVDQQSDFPNGKSKILLTNFF
ncbi:unnamed protein product [Notodromas monacha]|uniref:Uncharacterized protein n=1 Tax=Notodromas monacha TaxID=399045 RepID=A0A7R9GAF9_9CRUS|nr:unnamed protein product [Notodromas monacha]CAG0913657.1 unnamed protein product [Notodromas monacha]